MEISSFYAIGSYLKVFLKIFCRIPKLVSDPKFRFALEYPSVKACFTNMVDTMLGRLDIVMKSHKDKQTPKTRVLYRMDIK